MSVHAAADQPSRRAHDRAGLFLITLASLFLVACGSGSGSPPGRPIRIGVIADLSQPPGATYGQALRATLDAGVAQINTTGGVNGRSLQLVYADPRNDPAEAVAQARQLLHVGQVDMLYGGTLDSECAAVQELAGWLGVVYVMGNACAGDALTASTCNAFSFRLSPAGRQVTDPLAAYIAGNLGERWALVYRDSQPGRAQADDWRHSFDQAGAVVAAEIAVPLAAADASQYLSAIPAGGSISGIIIAGTRGDQAKLLESLRESGYDGGYPIAGSGDLAAPQGTTPSPTESPILIGARPSGRHEGDEVEAPGDSTADQAGIAAIRAAMAASGFAGRADSRRLISALERLGAPERADLSASPIIMDPVDHQGRMEEQIVRIQGRSEEVLQRISPDRLPTIGACHV
jgi:ABC-type branched-subunit amino acid transport system substrate-binding protein